MLLWTKEKKLGALGSKGKVDNEKKQTCGKTNFCRVTKNDGTQRGVQHTSFVHFPSVYHS